MVLFELAGYFGTLYTRNCSSIKSAPMFKKSSPKFSKVPKPNFMVLTAIGQCGRWSVRLYTASGTPRLVKCELAHQVEASPGGPA